MTLLLSRLQVQEAVVTASSILVESYHKRRFIAPEQAPPRDMGLLQLASLVCRYATDADAKERVRSAVAELGTGTDSVKVLIVEPMRGASMEPSLAPV